ncbi:hypothetical protein V8E53_003171 [Lactarius tabidus]
MARRRSFHWFQNVYNNMFEDTFAHPDSHDLYNFLDGAKDDSFEDSYINSGTEPPRSTFAVSNTISPLASFFLGSGSLLPMPPAPDSGTYRFPCSPPTQLGAIQLEPGLVVRATPDPLSGAPRSQGDASDVDPGSRE